MKKKLLIIGFVWPEPKSSAAGSRMLQLIAEFKKQDFQITFASTAKVTSRTADLHKLDVIAQTITLNCASFDDFICSLDPDLVLFDRFMTEEQFGWRVAQYCPKALRVLDTEDFHGLRKGRALALKQDEDFTTKHLQNDVTKREIASIYRCDLSLIISEAEFTLLPREFKIDDSLLYYLPFLMTPILEKAKSSLPTFEMRAHFITIGNFLHAPNYDSVLYLKESIWPLIREALPQAELHIYGAYPSQKATQLHAESEGFLIKGFAKEVNSVMQNAKVCLAPLRFGAGLKGKLVDAMQNGTPCVMSSIAAEGMFGDMLPNGYVSDEPEDFVQRAVNIYRNKRDWIKFQYSGFQILAQRFNAFDFETEFAAKIAALQNNLEAHRQHNFTGQLLMHHTLQSTKYMSKWIEEKNK